MKIRLENINAEELIILNEEYDAYKRDLETVEDLFSIEDVETKEVWDFTGNFNQLKDMRKGLPFDVEKMVEGEEIKLQ